jgi:hypothetical protein
MEDLTAAGVRFLYFSPRNMRRSKPVAEKIGIQFDWNCAISLRDLDPSSDEHDPHRHISHYADWDVHAKMPHGLAAIRQHLRVVDNVPLLVSLYTDSTPDTTREMIQVFREYGEVVLTVGAAYRAQNQAIFDVSSLAVAVAMLPGSTGQIPASVDDVLEGFSELPALAQNQGHQGQGQQGQGAGEGLCQADLLLTFRLVSLGSTVLLQLPSSAPHPSAAASGSISAGEGGGVPFSISILAGGAGDNAPAQVRLGAILEAVRKGRVFLLNSAQALALICVSVVSLAAWPLAAQAVPMGIPPSLPPSMALLFLLIYLPALSIALLFSPAPVGVLKATPRKALLQQRPGDLSRFLHHLAARAGVVALSVFCVGWLVTCRSPSDATQQPSALSPFLQYQGALPLQASSSSSLSSSAGSASPEGGVGDDAVDAGLELFSLSRLWFVQDVMSCVMLLGLLGQAVTLTERCPHVAGEVLGFPVPRLPRPWTHPYFFLSSLGCLAIHAAVLFIRSRNRLSSAAALIRADLTGLSVTDVSSLSAACGLGQWQRLDAVVWAVVLIAPAFGAACGLVAASIDGAVLRKHLQFLGLEFGTRLGQWSPRA